MDNFADRLGARIFECNNPTVMGLDPLTEYLPQEIRRKHGLATADDPGSIIYSDVKNQKDEYMARAANAILEFNMLLIDAVSGIIPAVKPQIAYYEILGHAGIKAYTETITYAKKHDMLVIADAKRNDIGSTASMYSSAFLGETDTSTPERFSAFDADALTVNAYTGYDGIEPFIKDCKTYDKGIFILVRTSNPPAAAFQDLNLENGKYRYEAVAEKVALWGKDLVGHNGYSSVGAVVGATWPEQAGILRRLMPETFILVPGYGAQGGTGETVSACFDKRGGGAVVNASRSLMLAYRNKGNGSDDLQTSAYNEAIRMKNDLNSHIFA